MGITIDGVESRPGIEYVKVPPDVIQLMADLPAKRQQEALLGAYVRYFLGLPVGKVPKTVSPSFMVASRIADRIVTGILTGGTRNNTAATEPVPDEYSAISEPVPDEYSATGWDCT